jgi:hypothetical protein
MGRANALLAALAGAQAGGLLAQPPGLDGDPGLGIAGVSGVPRGRTWDAVGAARCPGLPGDEITFVTLEDGTLVVDADVPDGSLGPLADSLEKILPPPYRAAGLRTDGDTWTAVAESVLIVELPGVEGDEIELSVVDGERDLTIDGERTIRALPALDALTEEQGSAALRAERVDGDLFAVDVFPL